MENHQVDNSQILPGNLQNGGHSLASHEVGLLVDQQLLMQMSLCIMKGCLPMCCLHQSISPACISLTNLWTIDMTSEALSCHSNNELCYKRCCPPFPSLSIKLMILTLHFHTAGEGVS